MSLDVLLGSRIDSRIDARLSGLLLDELDELLLELEDWLAPPPP